MDGGRDQRARLLALRVAGAGLLAAAGAIHLDLYLTGYRSIPTIGWLFLLQVIAAFALAIAALVISSPLAALAGAGFAISTLGGYLLSLWVGLFGFKEVRTTAGIVAGVIEIGAFAVLAVLAVAALGQAAARERRGVAGGPGTAAGGPATAAGGQATAAGGPASAKDGGPGRAERPGPLAARLAAASTRLPASPTATLRAIAGLSAVALAVLVISVAGAGGTAGSTAGPAATTPPAGPTVVITISNFKFSPQNPRVSPGERIEVKNADSVAHTFSAGPATKIASLFNSGSIDPGQVKFLTAPGQAGRYSFYCKIHPFMTGLLVVGDSTPGAAALASLQAATARMTRSGCGRPLGRLARRPAPANLAPSI
jgi:plastocyanin